jgi:hypothetical protein
MTEDRIARLCSFTGSPVKNNFRALFPFLKFLGRGIAFLKICWAGGPLAKFVVMREEPLKIFFEPGRGCIPHPLECISLKLLYHKLTISANTPSKKSPSGWLLCNTRAVVSMAICCAIVPAVVLMLCIVLIQAICYGA